MDTLYLIIPNKLILGRIDTLKSDVYFSDAKNYIFSFNHASPHAFKDAGYLMNVENSVKKVSNNLGNVRTLDPYQLMDSLTKHGRSFLRENVFYAVFFKQGKYFIHRAKGEYLYMNYEDDVQ